MSSGQSSNQGGFPSGPPAWPGGQQPQPTWPGGQQPQPTWPGGQQPQPTWPGGPQPQPTWPGGPQPQPTWPGGPQPQPTWPGAPQPSQPAWPGTPSGPSPSPGSWPSPSPGPGPAPSPSFPAFPQKNQKVSHSHNLSNGVYDKLLITITGMVKPKTDRFAIDLFKGSDIAFHFNPRFNEDGKKVIVRNTLIGSQWGKEERELGCFPFTLEKNFEIKILASNSGYKVAVDGNHILEYKHRVNDLRSIQRLSISSEVKLTDVKIEKLH